MNDGDILAKADRTLEHHTRAVNALAPVLHIIRGFEGVDAHVRNPRLNVDQDGTPSDDTPPAPPGWITCSCNEQLPAHGEFVTCWRCGKTTATTEDRDALVDAALKSDQSRLARAALTRHLVSIELATDRLIAELARWCRPSKTEVEALRRAVEGEVAQDSADHDQWCRIHARHGHTEPRSTRPTYERLGMCEGCGKLYAALQREPHITDASATLDRLVKAGHAPTPTAAQVAQAAKVTEAQVAEATPRPASNRPLPDSVRRRDGQPHHTTEDYLDTTGITATQGP